MTQIPNLLDDYDPTDAAQMKKLSDLLTLREAINLHGVYVRQKQCEEAREYLRQTIDEMLVHVPAVTGDSSTVDKRAWRVKNYLRVLRDGIEGIRIPEVMAAKWYELVEILMSLVRSGPEAEEWERKIWEVWQSELERNKEEVEL